MCEVNLNTIQANIKRSKLSVNTIDPTRTLTLRNAFVRDLNRRFNTIAREVRMSIVVEDVFGLKEPEIATFATPGPEAFKFDTNPQKVAKFMEWLRGRVNAEILETTTFTQLGESIDVHWTNTYISDSYKRGFARARFELGRTGFDVPSISTTGGVEISMSTPFHIDRLGLIYTRTFQGLKGITANMDTQISRILAQGLGDGDGPLLLARKIINTMTGGELKKLGITDTLGRFIPAKRRAEILARTEMIRAHHQATIQEYKNWGAAGVVVKAEWATAGDDRVCSVCAGLQGSVWPLEEIMNMIPQHPLCRCIALPIKPGMSTTEWNELAAVKSGELPRLKDVA